MPKCRRRNSPCSDTEHCNSTYSHAQSSGQVFHTRCLWTAAAARQHSASRSAVRASRHACTHTLNNRSRSPPSPPLPTLTRAARAPPPPRQPTRRASASNAPSLPRAPHTRAQHARRALQWAHPDLQKQAARRAASRRRLVFAGASSTRGVSLLVVWWCGGGGHARPLSGGLAAAEGRRVRAASQRLLGGRPGRRRAAQAQAGQAPPGRHLRGAIPGALQERAAGARAAAQGARREQHRARCPLLPAPIHLQRDRPLCGPTQRLSAQCVSRACRS